MESRIVIVPPNMTEYRILSECSRKGFCVKLSNKKHVRMDCC